MWDTYSVVRPTAPNVTVNMKPQPNDAADSARLYGELRDKAEREVASATVEKLGASNELTVLRVDGYRDYLNDRNVVRFLFKLNGVTHDIVVRQERAMLGARHKTFETLAIELMESITSEIARIFK